MGHEGGVEVKDGRDRDEDDRVAVWCFPERKTEMRMIGWLCGVSLKERQPSTELRRRLGVEEIGDVMRRFRLSWWHGHVERKDDGDYVKACTRLVVEGKIPQDVKDRGKWRAIGWRKANQGASGTLP